MNKEKKDIIHKWSFIVLLVLTALILMMQFIPSVSDFKINKWYTVLIVVVVFILDVYTGALYYGRKKKI